MLLPLQKVLLKTTTLFSDLDALVNDINTQAVNKEMTIRAKADNGKLILDVNGKTIGAQVTTLVSARTSTTVTASFDLAQIFGGSAATVTFSATASSDTDTGSGIKVGDLTIAGLDSYSYDFSGISTASAGLGLATSGDATATGLYSIDVTTNNNAELALDIVTKALQKVDKIRSQIGATMNNLQSIFDS
jgi:flagellin